MSLRHASVWLGRGVRALSLVLVVASTALAQSKTASQTSQPRNVLQNPGFEEGVSPKAWMPAGWDTSKAGLETVFFGRDTFMVHSGNYAATVANASALLPYAHNWHQTVPVTSAMWGKDAVFSIWTRNNGVEGRAYVLVQAFRDSLSKMAAEWKVSRDDARRRLGIAAVDDPLIDLGWKRDVFSDFETDWTRREVRVFVPPSVNMLYVRAGVIGTGQLIIDDASLTFEPALPPPDVALNVNLLTDPGFEGDGSAWEYSLPPFPDMRAERDTTVAHGGKASVRFLGPAGALVKGRAGISQAVCNRALAGKRIRLTGYVKCDSLQSSSAYMTVYCHTLNGAIARPANDQYSGTTEWKKWSVEVDVPPDTYVLWPWLAYTAPAPGVVRFDDVSLVVLGPSLTSTGAQTPKGP